MKQKEREKYKMTFNFTPGPVETPKYGDVTIVKKI